MYVCVFVYACVFVFGVHARTKPRCSKKLTKLRRNKWRATSRSPRDSYHELLGTENEKKLDKTRLLVIVEDNVGLDTLLRNTDHQLGRPLRNNKAPHNSLLLPQRMHNLLDLDCRNTLPLAEVQIVEIPNQ